MYSVVGILATHDELGLVSAQSHRRADAARLNAAQLSAAERISLAGANAAIALAEATMAQSRIQAEQLALHERMLQVYIEVQYARPDPGPVPDSGSAGVAF